MSAMTGSPVGGLGLTVKDGVTRNNPILVQALGICSALAVTSLVKPTLVMGIALVFVSSFSCLLISLMRQAIPHRVRLIVQMLVISVLVIVVHLYLRAYHFDMSERLGPYVGLIITNCIILGRCEAYAMRNGPLHSFLDGLGSAAGYALILLLIAVVREPLGSGTLLGFPIMDQLAGLFGSGADGQAPTYPSAMLLKAAPGAFITMGAVVWVIRAVWPEAEPTEHPEALN